MSTWQAMAMALVLGLSLSVCRRRCKSKSKSNRNVIARAKPKAESNRINATLAWKCHALANTTPFETHTHIHTHSRTPLFRLGLRLLLIFIVGSYLWLQYLPLTGNRWNFYASASAPFILFMFLRISACAGKNIFHSKYFVCCVWCNTHAHTQPSPKHLHPSLIFHFHRVWVCVFFSSSIEFRQFGGLTKSFLVLMNLYVLFVQCMQNFVSNFVRL